MTFFEANPDSSIRKAAQILHIKKSSLHRILKYFLKMHPYKISIHQYLSNNAKLKRLEFCTKINIMFEEEELDEKAIIFTDEAHFWLHGYVNKQNYRFWGTENPFYSTAKPLHSQKVTAWTAISRKGIYIQFFENTVTGESYKQLLEDKFLRYARKKGLVNGYYFMQDGAPPHRTKPVFDLLNDNYGNRVIAH